MIGQSSAWMSRRAGSYPRVQLRSGWCTYVCRLHQTWTRSFTPILLQTQHLSVMAAFPRLRGFGQNDRPFIPRLRFFFFFLKWRLARADWFHSLCQDKSTVAQQAETTVVECSLTSCRWARFRISTLCLDSCIVSPFWLRWVKGCMRI